MIYIAKWAVFVLHVLGGISVVFLVGRPRKPITPGEAVVSVLVFVGAAVLIAVYWRT